MNTELMIFAAHKVAEFIKGSASNEDSQWAIFVEDQAQSLYESFRYEEKVLSCYVDLKTAKDEFINKALEERGAPNAVDTHYIAYALLYYAIDEVCTYIGSIEACDTPMNFGKDRLVSIINELIDELPHVAARDFMDEVAVIQGINLEPMCLDEFLIIHNGSLTHEQIKQGRHISNLF